MSQYHVLDDAQLGNRLRVAVHTTVPGGSNSAQPAAMLWVDAVQAFRESQDEGGVISSVIPGLDPVAHGLTTGATVETVITVPDDANAANRLTVLEAAVSTESANVGSGLQVQLKYYGAEGTGS